MTSTRGRRAQQRALFDLLQGAEAAEGVLTEDQIAAATGWKSDTFRTYRSKGQFDEFLYETPDGHFEVGGTSGLMFDEFIKQLTQSKHVREIGHHCKSRLAKALLRKSRDNMILALELYNRPSLDNRLDAFALLFCAAWEQLLKAIRIERSGEESIFRAAKHGRPRETISLGECLEGYDCSEATRKNLIRIKELRDKATHLTMPELQATASRLFQSGVLNYARCFKEFARLPFVPRSTVGLLTLVVDATSTPAVGQLKGAYGAAIGAEVLDLVETLEREIEEIDDQHFAIPVRYRLVFSDRDEPADISLTKATTAARDAVIIEKTRDHRKTHPYTMQEAIEQIMVELRNQLPLADLEKRLEGRKDGAPVFNRHDHRAVLSDTGWVNSNNSYHHALTDKPPILRKFSDKYVHEVVHRIVKDEQFIRRVRHKLRGQSATKNKSTGEGSR